VALVAGSCEPHLARVLEGIHDDHVEDLVQALAVSPHSVTIIPGVMHLQARAHHGLHAPQHLQQQTNTAFISL
jgi:hypothetical protein